MLSQIDVIIVLSNALNEHLGHIGTASINHMMRTAYTVLAGELNTTARKAQRARKKKMRPKLAA